MVNQAFQAPKTPDLDQSSIQYKSPQSNSNKKLIVILLAIIVVLLLVVGVIAGYLVYKINSGGVYNSEIIYNQQATTTDNQTSSVATTTNENASTSSAISISWNSPQQIGSLKLFKSINSDSGFNPETTAKYYKVGTVNNGQYQGGEVILVSASVDGPAMYPAFYRFIKLSNSVIALKTNSDEISDYSGLDMSKVIVDANFHLAELDFPQAIVGRSARENLTLDQYVNALFVSNNLKPAFVDSRLGQIYASNGYDASATDLFLRNGFYVKASDGTVKIYSLKPDIFKNETNIPQITWSDGKSNTIEYGYTDRSGCGSQNYASVMPESKISMDDLKIVGTSSKGDSIYELKDSNNALLKDMYNNKYTVLDGQKKVPYATFIASHPIFFWTDPFGRLIKFESTKYQPLAECGKPVIYLYPTTAQNVSVKVEPQGGMSYSDPAYGQGWNVFSDTKSNLTDLATGKVYPYLFWEGSGGIYEQPKKGFVIKQSEVHDFLIEKLAKLGLNKKEIADFMEFWEPRMQGSPYYFVTFLGTSEMNKIAPLTINPKPDTVIRILMDFSPLAKPVKVDGYNITTPVRNGFTVVEWGGVLR